MIGIYKITKKENGKSYIGQSTDIVRRFWCHKHRDTMPIDVAIQKYGEDAFTYEIIEECSPEKLDERERYWIKYYNTYEGIGYNCNEGGDAFRGEDNGRTNLTNDDVYYIRECYNNHLRRKDVYENFKDKISFSAFAHIWDGSTWKHIHQDVYTEENKQFYMKHATDGENSPKSKFNNEEVLRLRQRYVNETAKKIYEDYKDKVSFDGFKNMLSGRTYKNVPIYKKKTKEWINK